MKYIVLRVKTTTEFCTLNSEGKIKTCSDKQIGGNLLAIDLPYKKCFKMLFYRERNEYVRNSNLKEKIM